ncbi:MAG TPA: phage tail protein [Burkholderiales bacterium]|nr:phage tail protein [Burkholderiales bacterium]
MPPRTSAFDPYRTFKFRVRLDGTTVAGVTKVSALGRTVAATEVKQGGDFLAPIQNPGQVTYDDVTLEQGWSADKALEKWANEATRLHIDPSVKNFKRTVLIDVYDLAGQANVSSPVTTYKLHRCWISKYVAMPDLSADGGGVGIRSVTLKHEGWERVT